MLKNAMSTLQLNQQDVEEVMIDIHEQDDECDIIHNTIVTGTTTTTNANETINDEELEQELLSLMQDSNNDDKEKQDLDSIVDNLERLHIKPNVKDSNEKAATIDIIIPPSIETAIDESKNKERKVELA
mmetsp:Transcript_11927/g.11477  ORF Transcript_11927/g.11477 Transcript_11927/m.11477 type:complete len:129 (+) Transcript_11927:111-497(+)